MFLVARVISSELEFSLSRSRSLTRALYGSLLLTQLQWCFERSNQCVASHLVHRVMRVVHITASHYILYAFAIKLIK